MTTTNTAEATAEAFTIMISGTLQQVRQKINEYTAHGFKVRTGYGKDKANPIKVLDDEEGTFYAWTYLTAEAPIINIDGEHDLNNATKAHWFLSKEYKAHNDNEVRQGHIMDVIEAIETAYDDLQETLDA